MTKRKLKDKGNIIIDRDTYRKLLEVYKKPTSIPHYDRIKIFTTTASEVRKDGRQTTE